MFQAEEYVSDSLQGEMEIFRKPEYAPGTGFQIVDHPGT